MRTLCLLPQTQGARHNQIDCAFKLILNINNILFITKIKLDIRTTEVETQHAPQKRKDRTLLKNPRNMFFKWQNVVELVRDLLNIFLFRCKFITIFGLLGQHAQF